MHDGMERLVVQRLSICMGVMEQVTVCVGECMGIQDGADS